MPARWRRWMPSAPPRSLAAAYASQSEAVAGADNSKIMTPLRTAQAIAAQPTGAHQHELADITDAGALAALDSVGTAQIDPAAYASQSEAVAGSDESKLMTALRTPRQSRRGRRRKATSTSSPTSPMPGRWRRWMPSAPPGSLPQPTPGGSVKLSPAATTELRS